MCNFPEEDQKILDSIVPRKKGIKILEIGSWTGTSTCVLGKIAKECGGFVIAVDHFNGSPNTWMWCEAHHKDIFAEFQKNIKEAGLEKYVFPIVLDSKTASRLMAKNSFDVVFIDGDHDFEAVKEDIINWRDKTKMLCGHDYGKSCWPGVKKAVDKLFKKIEVKDSIWLKKF